MSGDIQIDYSRSDRERRLSLLRLYDGDLDRARDAERWIWWGEGCGPDLARPSPFCPEGLSDRTPRPFTVDRACDATPPQHLSHTTMEMGGEDSGVASLRAAPDEGVETATQQEADEKRRKRQAVLDIQAEDEAWRAQCESHAAEDETDSPAPAGSLQGDRVAVIPASLDGGLTTSDDGLTIPAFLKRERVTT